MLVLEEQTYGRGIWTCLRQSRHDSWDEILNLARLAPWIFYSFASCSLSEVEGLWTGRYVQWGLDCWFGDLISVQARRMFCPGED